MAERIGLIAGNGQFPIIFAQAAADQGRTVVALAIKEETDPELENYVQSIHWIGVGSLGDFFKILRKEKLKKVVMCGQIKHGRIFEKNIAMDDNLKRFLNRVKDKRTDSLIGGIAKLLSRSGIKLLDSTLFLKDFLVRRGALTRSAPTPAQCQDIAFGRKIAKRIAGLDIGQTVVVREKAILAIEAIEGTDATIKRGGKYGLSKLDLINTHK
ncbi:LpxI family protein, partial [Candidatus Omnitrophota bacterium]